MGLNCGHLLSILGILRLVSIVVGIFTGSLAVSSYYISDYNRDCHGLSNSFPSLPETLPVMNPANLPAQNEGTTETLPSTEEIDANKDMAPVLWMEMFAIGVVWSGLIISLILLFLSLCSETLDYSKCFKALNFVFHFLWAVLLISSGIFVIYAANEIDEKICQTREFGEDEECQKMKLKLSSAGMEFILGLLYAGLSWKILGTKLYEEV